MIHSPSHSESLNVLFKIYSCAIIQDWKPGTIVISHDKVHPEPMETAFCFSDVKTYLKLQHMAEENSLTHCIMNRIYHTIYWKSPISILGTSGYEIYIFQEKNG